MVELKSPREIAIMREAGKRAAQTLRAVSDMIRPGITTADIDTFVREDTKRLGCIPAPLGYRGRDNSLPPYPASCCTSVNDVVCHGIPGPLVLCDGDIINVDVTHIWEGYHGDTSAMFYVGCPSARAVRVVEIARNALNAGIAEVKPGARLGDIGAAIHEYAESRGCSIVREFVGHGLGRKFHDEPVVQHFGARGKGIRLKAGMCFTIEPMVNLGSPGVYVDQDGWTVRTDDGKLSAQFEHSIVVTDDGCEVLTVC